MEAIKKVTVVFTSCGRFDLLDKTINSFLRFNHYPIEKFIVIDNSVNPNLFEIVGRMFPHLQNVSIMANQTNVGQVLSIDKAYSNVTTPYIFHCEDDWEFLETGFVEKSLDVLEHDSKISNVNLRMRGDGEKGSYHPVEGDYTTLLGTKYHLYVHNYLGEWHGFSWNPGLRRLSDYLQIAPYKQYANEQGVNQVMKNLGFSAACLELPYCKHIGTNSTTPKSNS